MSRYGDNCEAHDLPRDECIYCVREALDKSVAEINRLKQELEEANTIANDNYQIILGLRSQLTEARAEIERLEKCIETERLLYFDGLSKVRQEAARECLKIVDFGINDNPVMKGKVLAEWLNKNIKYIFKLEG